MTPTVIPAPPLTELHLGPERVTLFGIAASPRDRRRPPVLDARNVTRTYRTGWWPRRRVKPALRGAEVQLWPGEVVGLVGENSSGTSTLMTILVGALTRDAVDHSGSVCTRAKLNLGLALLPDPDLLFLDEPYAGHRTERIHAYPTRGGIW